MSGRAGRRGKDESGTVLLYVDKDSYIPRADELEQVLDDTGQDLESKLQLSYRMILNMMENEAMPIEQLIQNSFFQNNNEQQKLLKQQQKRRLTAQLDKVGHTVECIYGVPEEIWKYGLQMEDMWRLNQKYIAAYGAKKIQAFTLVEVLTEQFVNEIMLVTKALPTDKNIVCLFAKKNYSPQLQYEPEGAQPRRWNMTDSNIYYEYVTVKEEQISWVFENQLDTGGHYVQNTGRLVSECLVNYRVERERGVECGETVSGVEGA